METKGVAHLRVWDMTPPPVLWVFLQKIPPSGEEEGEREEGGGINIQIMLTFLTQEKTEIKGNLLALVLGLITTTIEFRILSRMF